MSPAKDYSHIINKWESIKELEKKSGKIEKLKLPHFNISIAPDFMSKIEKAVDYKPSVFGERPAVWLYIHGPSHQKALKASRQGDILLTASEKYAVMDAIIQKSFSEYPQERLNNAWEAKIYPDHGWGGVHGDITDNMFLQKFTYARDEASQMVENSTKSIASFIKTSSESGIPVVVFNSLSWERDDIARFNIKFEKGEVHNFEITNIKNESVYSQTEKAIFYDDKSIKSATICFLAEDIPSLGYKTYYLKSQRSKPGIAQSYITNNYENDFYRIKFNNGGLSGIYDKELQVEILNTEKFNGAEVFTMESEGNGAGEFDKVQQPTMEGFDKVSNYKPVWKHSSDGEVYTAFKMRQKIRNAVVELNIKIYKNIKRIDFEIALLNWEGILYREYRMALPLNMENGQVSYEVPYGVSEVGKDEIKGAAGERYKVPAKDIHPRAIENWIGASNDKFGVTLSSSVAAADYIDPTDNQNKSTILQPILLASRRSCHGLGNEYLQTGDHYFNFSFTSHASGWGNGFRFGKEANEKLHVVVNPRQYSNAYLPSEKSFFSIDNKDIIVSATKKCDDDNSIILRLYNISDMDKDITINTENIFSNAILTNIIEEEHNSLNYTSGKIKLKIGHNAIETIKLKLKGNN